jgi:hypothetical protein
MVAFIKSVFNLKRKLIAVYTLNVTDILLTLALLSTGAFREGNPVMIPLMGSAASALAVKLVLPGALLALLYLRLRGAAAVQLKNSNLLICVLLAFYTLINISHIVWIAIYLAVQPLV